jgi:hypothetical protein
MRIAVASMGTVPEAWVGIRFGMCSQFLVFDLEARGLTILVEGIQIVDYDGFVELVEQHHVVPWL